MKHENRKEICIIAGIFAFVSLTAAIILQKSMGYFCSLSSAPASLEYALSKARDFLVVLFTVTLSAFAFLMLRQRLSLLASSFAVVIIDSAFFLFASIGMYISILDDPIGISTSLIAYSSILAGIASLAILLISSVTFSLIKLFLYIRSKITKN